MTDINNTTRQNFFAGVTGGNGSTPDGAQTAIFSGKRDIEENLEKIGFLNGIEEY